MLSTPHDFYWDRAKAVSNYRKHGVPFEKALMAIEDPLAVARHDLDHGRAEGRWVTLGEAEGKLLCVVHTLEELDDQTIWVRIISARHPTPDERRQYETGKYRIEEAIMVNKSNPDQWVRGRFYSEERASFLPVYIARNTVVSLITLAEQRGITPSELADELLIHAIAQPPFIAASAEGAA